MINIPQLSPTQLKALLVIGIIAATGAGAGFTIVEHLTTQQRLILATTTSTYDSGLLDYLLPPFEAKWSVDVQVIAVGTGQALALGKTGDCDVVMVHARSQEDAFVNDGYGVHRVTVWYNDFVIVGPPDDPANITGLNNATEAFIRIYNAGENGKCTFYSRGDGSGTESKEISIWMMTGLGRPDDEIQTWYKKTGQGMGATLTVTNNDPKGYTLTDRGTYISLVDTLQFLTVLVENDKVLLNPYGVILVNVHMFPNVNYQTAVKFVAYLCAPETQEMVNNYKKNNLQIFFACYGISNATELGFDTDEQVAEYLNFWNPIIQLYYS